ncbi:HAD family hydrolase [Arsenicicoccus dermatophilus]|uniref:HAD family hydrolase n=1 Tax=Arsenicicoccus dermatophilus TaxID=1076331 RepID=UPI001F4C9331|nr:HAD family hydrolase [Arsenicicoccus dermatophilus]MCH8611665.1 Cof-type HAD-IIB family hydrolase [Arsenicicoccus dermatophilus]
MSSCPRVFATDFDGTLLRSDHTLSARSVAAISAAESAGCLVVVVTARPPRWMDEFRAQVGAHGLVICGNGSFVYDAHGGTVVEEHPIDRATVLEVVGLLRAALPGTAFALEGRSGMAAEDAFVAIPGPSGEPVRDTRRVGPLETLLDEELPGKLLARHPATALDEFLVRAAEVVGDRVQLAYSGAPGLAEMTARGVTKAVALQRWCAEHGIQAGDVWAFGDMPNDIPMLAWAGRGYAVGNAHPQAVAAASHRCGRNDEDGVAQVIEEALRQRTAPTR